MTTFYLGTIQTLQGSWGSGIAALVFQDGKSIYSDNGPLVRALDEAFEGVIGSGHSINIRAIQGKKIVYFYDDMGLTMGGFVPLSNWIDRGFPEPGPDGITEEELKEAMGITECEQGDDLEDEEIA